jgi:hypothetical protein
MPGTPHTDLALQAQDIRKQFGNFTALNGITIDIRRGEFVRQKRRGQNDIPEDCRDADAGEPREVADRRLRHR